MPLDLNPIGIKMILSSNGNSINKLLNSTTQADIDKILSTTTINNGKYTINGVTYIRGQVLGNGSFGAVYLCTNEADQKEYALKVQKITKGIPGILSVIREAVINYVVQEDNKDNEDFPRIYGIGIVTLNAEPAVCTIIDYYKGKSLQGRCIELDKNLDEKSTVINNAQQTICKSLKDLWVTNKFNHCDLHAQNVLYTEENKVKLIDFGYSHIKVGSGKIKKDFCANTEYTLFSPRTDLPALVTSVLTQCGKLSADQKDYLEKLLPTSLLDIVKAKPGWLGWDDIHHELKKPDVANLVDKLDVEMCVVKDEASSEADDILTAFLTEKGDNVSQAPAQASVKVPVAQVAKAVEAPVAKLSKKLPEGVPVNPSDLPQGTPILGMVKTAGGTVLAVIGYVGSAVSNSIVPATGVVLTSSKKFIKNGGIPIIGACLGYAWVSTYAPSICIPAGEWVAGLGWGLVKSIAGPPMITTLAEYTIGNELGTFGDASAMGVIVMTTYSLIHHGFQYTCNPLGIPAVVGALGGLCIGGLAHLGGTAVTSAKVDAYVDKLSHGGRTRKQRGGTKSRAKTRGRTTGNTGRLENSINYVKQKIQQKETIPANQQRLVFQGQDLENQPHIKLSDDALHYIALPLEELFNDLRFKYFEGASEKDKKDLLKIAMYVALKRPTILEQVLFSIADNNIQQCKEILSKHKMSREEFIAIMAKSGIFLKKVKDIEEIIDLYFTESDPFKALALFRTLNSFNIYDPEEKAYKDFIKAYKEAGEKEKESYRTMFMYDFISS